jgi:hypothetical protein
VSDLRRRRRFRGEASGTFIGINPRATIVLGAPTHGGQPALMDASASQNRGGTYAATS